MTAPARRQVSHACAHPSHGARGRPSMQVVDTFPRPFPYRAAHALTQVTPEKVEAFAATREVDCSGLLRMQLEPETREHAAHPPLGLLDRRFRVAHDHEWSGALTRWCTGAPWLCPPFPASCPCRCHHHSVFSAPHQTGRDHFGHPASRPCSPRGVRKRCTTVPWSW